MESGDVDEAVLTTAAPGRGERAIAVVVVVASALVLALVAPFARVHLGEVKAFIPAYEAALLITRLAAQTGDAKLSHSGLRFRASLPLNLRPFYDPSQKTHRR